MSIRELSSVLFALLVVLSGCTVLGPGSDDGPATQGQSPTPTGDVESRATATVAAPTTEAPGDAALVLEDELSVDARQVLERVERLRGLELAGPVEIHTYEIDDDVAAGTEVNMPDNPGPIERRGARALQLYSDGGAVPGQPMGYVHRKGGVIHVHAMNRDGLDTLGLSQESVLAHEFVHVLQYQHGIDLDDGTWPETSDGQTAWFAVVEGNAALVQQQYRDRYLTNTTHVTDRNVTGTRAGWAMHRVSIAYYYGYQYALAADDWDARSENARYPRVNTTAALLHPDSAPTEPGQPVPVPDVDGLIVTDTDGVGELLVRLTLRTNGASFPEAARAAHGWRNDTMVYYDDTEYRDVEAVYWGTRWANASEAAEFAGAWRAMLDRLNASRSDELVVVPARTDRYPTVYYAIDRSGAVVRIAAGEDRSAVRQIAAAWNGSAG